MDRECDTHGRGANCQLGDLDIDGRMIFKWIFIKWLWWYVLGSSGMGLVASCFKYIYEPSYVESFLMNCTTVSFWSSLHTTQLVMVFCSFAVTAMGFMQHLSVCVTVALLFLCAYHTNGAVTQPPVVQDPAFVGAGTEAGLRIWRIEASFVCGAPSNLCV